MDFKDQIRQIADRIENLKGSLQTEEATKNALILPFLSALGYDVFNPLEVLPEMCCDIGKKKGEKIDYAILMDNEPVILIECKHWSQNLNLHETQLLRYFTVSNAKFGILTNGITYRFYTDLDEVNKMDEKPFFEVNLLDLRDAQIEELKKFHKSYFDIHNVLSSASELKYLSELKAEFAKEFDTPSPELIKLLGKRIVSGTFTTKMQEQFAVLVKRAVSSHINDIISNRLKTAIEDNENAEKESNIPANDPAQGRDERISTTEEEIEGYHVVKSIVRSTIGAHRVFYRDSISYFSVLADDNNRRPICRLYFNSSQKYIGVFDAEKNETKHKIETLDDIYSFEEQLKETAGLYL